jgi:hypothetical protein
LELEAGYRAAIRVLRVTLIAVYMAGQGDTLSAVCNCMCYTRSLILSFFVYDRTILMETYSVRTMRGFQFLSVLFQKRILKREWCLYPSFWLLPEWR